MLLLFPGTTLAESVPDVQVSEASSVSSKTNSHSWLGRLDVLVGRLRALVVHRCCTPGLVDPCLIVLLRLFAPTEVSFQSFVRQWSCRDTIDGAQMVSVQSWSEAQLMI